MALDEELEQLTEDIKRIKQRQSHIATLWRTNNGQRHEWLGRKYKSAIVPYSKAWNRDFAANMHARLPRELRDLIYEYLLDQDDFGNGNWTYLCEVVSNRKATSEDFDTPYAGDRIRHFLGSEYMGHAIPVQILKVLYRKPWFSNEYIEVGLEDLHHAINGDPFGVGFCAASVLGEVNFTCKIDRYRRTPCIRSKNHSYTRRDRVYIDTDNRKTSFRLPARRGS